MNAASLTFSSSQAPNAESNMHAVIMELSKMVSLPIELITESSWESREAALDSGEIQLGWICGLPYVWKADIPNPGLELLAAPVMASDRYEDRPIYFSDVVVRTNSPYLQFEDLRRATWAYNEPRSHSGYNITRFHLAQLGEKRGYFSKIVEAGSHERALSLILKGKVDASALDSTVLETEIRKRPELSRLIRVIDILGPSPIPPLVVHKNVPYESRAALRKGLINLHKTDSGRKALAKGAYDRFVAVQNSDYDPIREMEAQAKTVESW
jgi:phosphonate transport system substrate-binding protein